MKRRNRNGNALSGQPLTQFIERNVPPLLIQRKDHCLMRLDPPRPLIAALRPWGIAARPALLIAPPNRRRGATPKRVAAARQLIPPSIAANVRNRKSIDSHLPIHASLHPQPEA